MADKIEPWFGAKYTVEKIPPSTIQVSYNYSSIAKYIYIYKLRHFYYYYYYFVFRNGKIADLIMLSSYQNRMNSFRLILIFIRWKTR